MQPVNPMLVDLRRARPRLTGVTSLVGLALFAALWASSPARSDESDGVIEQWDQRWTWNADGSCVYYEKKHVRLNSERTYREFADPRITYDEDLDTVEVLAARTRLPDGSYVETPKYGYNLVSPSAAAGWPAFAGLRQLVVSMSGVQPGCVVELEYKVTSKPGQRRHLAGDLRLDHQYPVRQRSITFQVPADVPLAVSLTGVPAEQTEQLLEKDGDRNLITRRVAVRDLPGVPHEPQEPPWQQRCPRLAFSTGGSVGQWLADRLGRIESSADESELITGLARRWTEEQTEPGDKLRAIQEKLSASFNFVSFEVAWGGGELRPASVVLRSNYGLPAEATAGFLALCRAAGLQVRLGVLVPEHVWDERTPQEGFVAGFVLLLEGPGELEIWHPQHGQIRRSARWSGHKVLSVVNGQRRQIDLPPWTDADESRCVVGGKLTLAEDGSLSGTLSIRTTGLFVASEKLRSSEEQRGRVSGLVGHVLPEAELADFTVKTLSPSVFEVEAEVKSSEPLEKVDGCYPLVISQDGPFLADVPMPLAFSRRTHAVQLTGAFDERIELTIEWPEDWGVEVQPIGLSESGEAWMVAQGVVDGEHNLTLKRHTRVSARELPAEDFLALRSNLIALRTDGGRILLLKP